MSNEIRPAIQDTRERILATGECLILGKGFSAMGLSELLSAAAVPKGSFYHYFASKEAFGVALLERYFRDYQQKTALLFDTQDISAKQKLVLYFDQWRSLADVPGCNKLCLGVKLAAEVSDLSDAMRQALSTGMALHCDQIAGVIRDAIQEGSIAPVSDPSELASFLYGSWIGASILAKVRQDAGALHAAHRQTMQALFGTTL